MFGWYQNCFYLCTRFSEVKYSGCSAVRLAHLLQLPLLGTGKT